MEHSLAISGMVLCVACAATAHAQQPDYPSKPIQLIVTLPPGAGVDLVARMVAIKMAPPLKQQVVVENKAGGNGLVGAETVARATPDGYTLLYATATTMVTGPLMSKDVAYPPLSAYAPVSLTVSNPFVLTVNNALPVRSTAELIALAKQKPGALNFGTTGEGTPLHLSMELLMNMAGIRMVHVPYKGGAQAQTDLLAGRIQVYPSSIAGILPSLKAGKVRPLAVTTSKRAGLLPDVPTLAESGVPGYEFDTWSAVFGVAKTPAAVIGKLNGAIATALSDPELVKTMADQGADVRSSTPEALGIMVRSELERLGRVVEKIGATER